MQRQTDNRSDLSLLQATATGDRAAFDLFVVRHHAAVFRFATAISASASEGEEVLQAAFIAAWQAAPSFRAEGSARSWLFSIARNAHRRLYRRRAGEPATHEDLAALGCEAGWGEDLPPLSLQIERREWIERAMSHLSADDREVLVLVDIEGLSAAETAAAIELSVTATKSRLHRARLRLVAALRKEGTGG